MNAKAAIFSFSLFLVIFLLVAETTLAKPKGLDVDPDYARNKMFLPGHENPEAISEMVERQSHAELISSGVCFTRDDLFGSFRIHRGGSLGILRVDYVPSLPSGETKVLKLLDKSWNPVNPEYTTSDNIHFDFRFDNRPLKVSADETFTLYEESGSGMAHVCVNVYGYYAK